MGNMSTLELVKKAFQIDYSDSIHIIKETIWIPPGWVDIYDELDKSITNLGGRIIRVHYAKGILRILEKSTVVSTKWLIQGFGKQSSNTCMICSKRSYRRKSYGGWPSLCFTHIVEYANQLDEDKNV